jgi:probable addiction module antidote protein
MRREAFPFEDNQDAYAVERLKMLALAFQQRDSAFITWALDDLAHHKGITKVAAETGITAGGLYKALTKDGNPRLSTLLALAKVLDFRLTVEPIPKE